MQKYPYFILVTHEGRFPTPPQFKGTVIARQFETGKIGGTRAKEEQITEKVTVLEKFRSARFIDPKAEVYIIEGPNRPRRKLLNPVTDIQRLDKR